VRQKNKVWTLEEDERLKALVASGRLHAAAALKCSMVSARNQARKLGTPFPSIRRLKKRLASH
jgi:hypothetical protein